MEKNKINCIKKSKYLFKSSLTMLLLTFVLTIPFIIMLSISPTIQIEEDLSYSIGFTIVLTLFIILLILNAIFCIINAIIILSNDWKNKNLNDPSCKILWGVLSLVLLGLIASLIFSIIAKKELNKNNEVSSNANQD